MRALPSHFRPPGESKTLESSIACGTGLEMQSLGFFRFWALMYFSPTTFFKEHYRPYVLPHFVFAMIVVGIAAGVSMTQPRLPMSTGITPASLGMRSTNVADSLMLLTAFTGFLGIPGALVQYFGGGFSTTSASGSQAEHQLQRSADSCISIPWFCRVHL